jgi:hypothetical protein
MDTIIDKEVNLEVKPELHSATSAQGNCHKMSL